MKYKQDTKGTINQGFSRNANPLYKGGGLLGHTGIDSTKGFGSKVKTDNAGYVYKVINEGDFPSNWAAVYLLVPNGDEVMEVVLGHLSKIYVKEGQTIPEDYVVGLEGNRGDVYQGGTRITADMQRAGDTRGSHLHEQYRPTVKKKRAVSSKHYLTKKNGNRYRDKDKNYYEIVEVDNGFKGCIDPTRFYYKDTFDDKVRNIMNNLLYIQGHLNKMSSK